MRAMIFAAGLGTRLRPLTDAKPKALIEIGNKTLLEWQIAKLREAGITDIVVNVHHFPDLIIDYLRAHDNFGCSVSVSDERDRLLDTGGGLRRVVKNMKLDKEGILALNVDILSNVDIQALVQAYEQDGVSRLVVSERDTARYLLFNDRQNLVGWTNVTTGEVKPSAILDNSRGISSYGQLAFSGMQILSPRVCARLIDRKEESFSLIDFYLDICQKEMLKAYIPQHYRMFDVGKYDRLPEAERFAASL